MSKRKYKGMKIKHLKHEALHTTSNIIGHIHSDIVEHPYYCSNDNKEFNKRINKALEILSEAYLLLG